MKKMITKNYQVWAFVLATVHFIVYEIMIVMMIVKQLR